MRPRPHTLIIGALLKLGCVVVRDEASEEVITVCRGAVKLFHIPRGEVTVFVQRILLQKFNFSEEEFITALLSVN